MSHPQPYALTLCCINNPIAAVVAANGSAKARMGQKLKTPHTICTTPKLKWCVTKCSVLEGMCRCTFTLAATIKAKITGTAQSERG